MFCLGAGSMISSTHGTTSYLVVKGDDHLLIDIGPSTPQVLSRYGVNVSNINAVHITHAHGDHVAGFPKILIHNRFIEAEKGVKNKRIRLLANRAWAKTLWTYSLSGDLVTHDFPDPADPRANADTWYEVIASGSQSDDGRSEVYMCGEIRIETFRTAHTPASASGWQNSAWSTGVLIDDKVWISGDTRYDHDLIMSYVPRAEVFFHDMASGTSPVHACLDDFCRMRVAVRSRIIPIHYGDEWVKDGMPREEANSLVISKGFPGLAYTGMKVEFPA